jgi:hypothetical protein
MMKNEDQKVSLGFLVPLFFEALIVVWIKNFPKMCHGQEDQPSQSTKKSVRLVPVGGDDLMIR